MNLAGLKKLLGHDASPFVQFIKYGIAGGAATAVNAIVFFLLAWLLFPCLTEADFLVRPLGLKLVEVSSEKAVVNARICNAIGFLVSNIFCYFLNRLFVFKPGRHVWIIEILSFLGVSAIPFFIGDTVLKMLMQAGIPATLSYLVNIIAAVMLNYVARKFIIFKG